MESCFWVLALKSHNKCAVSMENFYFKFASPRNGILGSSQTTRNDDVENKIYERRFFIISFKSEQLPKTAYRDHHKFMDFS